MSASAAAVTSCRLASVTRRAAGVPSSWCKFATAVWGKKRGRNFLPVTAGLVPAIHERLRGYLVDARTAESGHDGERAARRGLTSAPPEPYSIPPPCR